MSKILIEVENLFLSFWGEGYYAAAAIVSECHKLNMRINGKEVPDFFTGPMRLDVFRKNPPVGKIEFCRVSGFDRQEAPTYNAKKQADFRWIVNMGEDLYGCPLPVKKSLLGPMFLLSEGEIYCKRFAPGPWSFAPRGNRAFVVATQNAIPDVIAADIELRDGDRAVLSCGQNRITLRADADHAVVLKNTCEKPDDPNGDFGLYNSVVPGVAESDFVVPFKVGGVLTGGPACGGGGTDSTPDPGCPPRC